MLRTSLARIILSAGLCGITPVAHGQSLVVSTAATASSASPAVNGTRTPPPRLGKYYTVLFGDVAGPRVRFDQTDDVLSSVWMTTEGEVYGRGTYQWDAAQGVFVGTAMNTFTCLATETSKPFTFQHSVREQLRVLNDREMLDRWTIPLDVDCSLGIVQKFKWIERVWVAADENWTPLK